MAEAVEMLDQSDGDTGHQYVTFQVAGEDFGFPMTQVAEIIRLPTTVGVPLTPAALIGLSNLRGDVLPVLDLRRILQLDEADYSEATRVVVADAGRPVGLVVDRVAKVMSVDDAQVESAEGVQTTTDVELLSGVIRDGEHLIQLMDVEQLIKQEFASVLAAAKHHVENTALANVEKSSDSDAVDEDDSSQLVSFTVDKQEYAFDLMEVEEIVRIPEGIAQMPMADHHVLGLIDLRGRLLPLVSLRRMFSLHEQELNEQNRILVISLRAVGGEINSVGIVVDDVREVLSVAHKARDDVPALLSKGQDNNEISAVCRLDGGKRLVSILSTGAMFQHPAIQAAVAVGIEENADMNDEELEVEESAEDADDTQLVVFKLDEQEYGVTIEDVQEITRVPGEMSKVPKTAEFIEGMVNLRGTVLPVLDMRSRFGLNRMDRNERQRILVLNLNGTRTGFIMDSVVEVLRLNRNSIEEAPDLSEDQKRVMGRVVNLKEQKRMIQVLDVHELLSKKEQAQLEKA
ncbi:MAG: chemotaxis protein CheW [Candidatus Thiodiazotropha sp.]